jgi:hypothetical protein
MTDTTDKALDALQSLIRHNIQWVGLQDVDREAYQQADDSITALRAQLAKARADALREAHERLWDKLGGQCRLEACDIVEALINTPTPSTPTPSAPSPEAAARAALVDAVAEALHALSWAKANLADYSFQIGEGRKDFPVLDRALARAAIVAKAGDGE